METVLSVLHVATAVFVIGPMAVLPMSALATLRAGHGAQVPALARSTAIFSWASLIVAILGFGVLGASDPKDDLSITTPWVLISLLAYLVALILSLAVVVPAMRRAGLEQSEGGTSAPTDGLAGRIGASSGIVALLLIAVVVLMVWKP